MRAQLLLWYDAHRRDLPWRRTRDPYAVWVSEIMLQQTRVETVVPYYERFMERFPSAAALARASEDEVLESWAGLGYYRRARMLHAGVREVVARYGGEVPEDPEARRALPGVGRYTAGAIGSIAFDREEPIVDGNVARVLSRFFAIEGSERALWARAEEIVRGPRPGDLNQALMELGARVCTPRDPRCAECPIEKACAKRVDLPIPRKRAEPKRVAITAVVALRAGRPILVRSSSELFRGLYGPPSASGHGIAAAREALAHNGVRARIDRRLGSLEHVLTHRRLEVEVWRATHARGPREPATYGLSTLARKIFASAGVHQMSG